MTIVTGPYRDARKPNRPWVVTIQKGANVCVKRFNKIADAQACAEEHRA